MNGTQLEKTYVESTIALVRESEYHRHELEASNRFLLNADEPEDSDVEILPVQESSSILELEMKAEVATGRVNCTKPKIN